VKCCLDKGFLSLGGGCFSRMGAWGPGGADCGGGSDRGLTVKGGVGGGCAPGVRGYKEGELLKGRGEGGWSRLIGRGFWPGVYNSLGGRVFGW